MKYKILATLMGISLLLAACSPGATQRLSHQSHPTVCAPPSLRKGASSRSLCRYRLQHQRRVREVLVCGEAVQKESH
jgi:hypothetical protein